MRSFVAAVILVNSDEGGRILNPFGRRLLEVLFDGKLEAEENVSAAARNMKAAVLRERSRLTIPADKAAAGKLAARYTNDAPIRISAAAEYKIDDLNSALRIGYVTHDALDDSTELDASSQCDQS